MNALLLAEEGNHFWLPHDINEVIWGTIAFLIVFGLLDGLTQRGDWELFFGIVGATTAAVGVVAWFLVRDRQPLERVADGYLASLVHGLRPSTMRAHPRLYVTLLAVAISATGIDGFGWWVAMAGLMGFAAHLVWQLYMLDLHDDQNQLRLFWSNRDAGMILAVALGLAGLLQLAS